MENANSIYFDIYFIAGSVTKNISCFFLVKVFQNMLYWHIYLKIFWIYKGAFIPCSVASSNRCERGCETRSGPKDKSLVWPKEVVSARIYWTMIWFACSANTLFFLDVLDFPNNNRKLRHSLNQSEGKKYCRCVEIPLPLVCRCVTQQYGHKRLHWELFFFTVTVD